ncbi:hypothetical protein EV424DRAFT_1348920 [Suillus variegatus]|nr:hypothetical protein EV424DRAFT_1348920 [Suillus variegatus]
MNQTNTYLVSAVTFLSELGITDQPVFGLVVDGALGAITMAWKTNNYKCPTQSSSSSAPINLPLSLQASTSSSSSSASISPPLLLSSDTSESKKTEGTKAEEQEDN